MTEETKQVDDVPFAPGLDEIWHAHTDSGADAADREKAAVRAQDFQQERALRYVLSEGRLDIGGFVSPSLVGGGRQINWLHMPRGMNWM
jgi:hypothetical protein